jgi:hypothetical protein
MSVTPSISAPAFVLAASEALRSALADFDPNLLLGPDCARIAEDLAVTEKACSTVRLLTASRAVDSGAHLSAGFKDGAAWLARQSRITNQQAKRDLATADLLEAPRPGPPGATCPYSGGRPARQAAPGACLPSLAGPARHGVLLGSRPVGPFSG